MTILYVRVLGHGLAMFWWGCSLRTSLIRSPDGLELNLGPLQLVIS